MANNTALARACEAIGCKEADVLDWAERDDAVVVVLISGPKHTILNADLPKPAAKPAPKKKAAAKAK